MRCSVAIGAAVLAACAPEASVDEDIDGSIDSSPSPQRPQITAVEGVLTESGPITCSDPTARDRLGPLYTADFGRGWTAQEPAGWSPASLSPAGGVAVADFTGDGLLDVFLPADSPCMLFVGQPDGTLVNESRDRIPGAADACRAWGASAGDMDNDGDLDLYVTRERAPDLLWENDGTGIFFDVTDAAGIPVHHCGGRSASWADIDADGDLDLFVARHRVILDPLDEESCETTEAPDRWEMPAGNPNSLLQNQGDGTFLDISPRLPIRGVYAYSFVGGWYDLDRDSDLDMVLINDFGATTTPTTAWLNAGSGHFSELDETAGLSMRIFGMSLSAGDLNRDGHPDFAITNIDRLHLLMSGGRLQWTDDAVARGLYPDPSRAQYAAWGVALEDVDNDGRVDLTAVYGPTEDPLAREDPDVLYQPDALFLQQPDGAFIDRAPMWGFDDTGVGRGLVVADLDGNGWLDFVRPNYRTGPTTILLQRCGTDAWATVALDGPGSGYGARVEMKVDGVLHTRWMDPTNESLGSTGPAQVHFGLGDGEEIELLRVFWPDGTVTYNRSIATRQHLRVAPPTDAP